MAKKALLILGAILIIIQFFRPEKNVSPQLITEDDISKTVSIPEDLHQTLIKKCYDCHSNQTNYPWYSNVQPVAWWLASHVNEGKDELNFSAFKTYDQKKATHKLEEIGEMVEEGKMPLKSYTLIHTDTKITPEDKQGINAWLASLNIDFKKEH